MNKNDLSQDFILSVNIIVSDSDWSSLLIYKRFTYSVRCGHLHLLIVSMMVIEQRQAVIISVRAER